HTSADGGVIGDVRNGARTQTQTGLKRGNWEQQARRATGCSHKSVSGIVFVPHLLGAVSTSNAESGGIRQTLGSAYAGNQRIRRRKLRVRERCSVAAAIISSGRQQSNPAVRRVNVVLMGLQQLRIVTADCKFRYSDSFVSTHCPDISQLLCVRQYSGNCRCWS